VAIEERTAVVEQHLDVPAEALSGVIGSWPEPALLESGHGFGDAGRWSILAAYPRLVFEATGSRWRYGPPGRPECGQGNVLDLLNVLLGRFGLAQSGEQSDPDAVPFQGGMIGFFGYDLAPQLERLPRRAARDSRIPDIRLALYDTAVAVDVHSGRAQLCAWDVLGEGPGACRRRARRWRRAIASAIRPAPTCQGRPAQDSEPRSECDPKAYLTAVRRVLDYIAAGDVYQVNVSHRFVAQAPADPLDLYLRLKQQSPAPFAAFLRFRDLAVVSSSPECFYQTRGDGIVTRPIKGTRPRGRDPRDDARLAAELLDSAKDRAELTMIVDLERNDLGRVCQYGSVVVRDPIAIETFAQVHHLVGTVEGRLRPGASPVEIIRAVFPGGSITGAPKIRAMEIIDELEPNRRGLYTGAIGYLSRCGSSAFNIAIRTILIEGDRATYQVGGGIVADSEPESEYEETLAKGRALRAVLEGQGGAVEP
jgi:para-aminobenzoate synthetase component 1